TPPPPHQGHTLAAPENHLRRSRTKHVAGRHRICAQLVRPVVVHSGAGPAPLAWTGSVTNLSGTDHRNLRHLRILAPRPCGTGADDRPTPISRTAPASRNRTRARPALLHCSPDQRTGKESCPISRIPLPSA